MTKKNVRPTKNNIIQLPEHESLKREVEKLRTEISMLILERDHLILVECKNLETAYMLSVGALEHKAYEAQCLMLRQKRKLELIQAKRNRQEKIVMTEIEDTLNHEFAEYQQKLNEQIEKMNQAIERSHCRPLTDEEAKDLKKLYRAVVKALHPDLHPGLTEAQRRMFQNALQAYENGDLKTLQIIYTMNDELDFPDSHEDALKVLFREKERLEKVITAIHEDIDAAKTKFPYTMKEFLSDERQVEKKKNELETIIQQYKDKAKHYQERIELMMG